jgi:ATP-binding cassette subfamily B protein
VDEDLRYIGDLIGYLAFEDASRPEQNRPLAAARLLSPRAGHVPTIRFEAVSFAYPETDRPALEEIEFTLRAGEHVALVGRNGAGKSTLAKLLLGLYRPTRGRIIVDGIDLDEIDPRWWRLQTTAVFQDFVRYELTVRENIGFSDPDRLADVEAIERAAGRGGAAELIAGLPSTYDTTLGRAYDERGQDLSVGQWQKLALARAYMRESATVLVLDEPTSALDARAEAEVYRSFHKQARGKSAIFISHRLVSARTADRILLLDAGRIVEQGSHAELMRRAGLYARLYATQAGWYQ